MMPLQAKEHRKHVYATVKAAVVVSTLGSLEAECGLRHGMHKVMHRPMACGTQPGQV